MEELHTGVGGCSAGRRAQARTCGSCCRASRDRCRGCAPPARRSRRRARARGDVLALDLLERVVGACRRRGLRRLEVARPGSSARRRPPSRARGCCAARGRCPGRDTTSASPSRRATRRPSAASSADEAVEEVLDEQRDVLAPIAQRRQRDRDDVEPVEQVLAELAVRDRLLQVAVGRGDDPDVDLDRLGAADAAELPRPRARAAGPAAASG